MSDLRFFAERVLDSHSDARAGEHWQAFTSGLYELVDQFDSDGRRYLIARKSSRPARLMAQEYALLRRRARGDALKEIAFDLGVSISAVSRRLSCAMKKLGVRSHTDLARVLPQDLVSSAIVGDGS